ncbi:MAG: Calx-beta domain-containing protein [Pseudomonadota bacterium]
MSGTIFLEADELSIGEAEGAADVAIVRTGDLSQPVTIEFGITGVGATPGSDFDARTGTVTMAAGEDRAIVSARVFDDALAEQTEAFAVSIINVSSGTLLAPRTARVEILDDENPQSDPPSPPLTSPYNVAQDAVIGGLSQPIDFEFAPQDQNLVYVAEKAGVVKIANAETGSVVSTFMDISDQVNDRQDRGLLDIALDPNFPDNPFVYAFYVVDPPEAEGQSGNAGRDGGGNRYAYVSRFEADATNDFLTVVPGSETVILGGAGQSLSDISGGGAVEHMG